MPDSFIWMRFSVFIGSGKGLKRKSDFTTGIKKDLALLCRPFSLSRWRSQGPLVLRADYLSKLSASFELSLAWVRTATPACRRILSLAMFALS